jgi:probable phosphoglycerate mutase
MSRTVRLCVVRHGETDWNAQGILQGRQDVPLNVCGRQQAAALAGQLAAAGFDALWSSPLRRARETAEIIAAHANAAAPLPSLRLHAGLQERSFGVLEGCSRPQLAATHPLLLQEILRRNPAALFPAGETMDAFADRVLTALLEIAAQQQGGGSALIISHGWVMDVIRRQLAGLPRHALLAGKPANGEMLWVEVAGGCLRACA